MSAVNMSINQIREKNNDNKKRLLELIETMSDNQILFTLTFLRQTLGKH